jgi:general secretion pathway protein D
VKKINELIKPGAGAGRSPQRSSYQSFKLLTDERSNSVIIFGPPRTISDIRTLVKKFDTKVDDPQSQATIHVRPLDYADAKKLAATLSSLTAGAKSANGLRRPPSQVNGGAGDIAAVASLGNDVKITADESTNSLLITGSRNAYDALNVLIRKLDQRRPQVFIAADILDITSDNGFKAGTSIFAGYKDGPGGSQGIIGWEAAGMAPLVIGQAAGAAAGVTTASSIAQSFSNDMTIGVLAGKSVDVPGLGKLTPGGLISLMKTDTNARVVSSPHVLTTTNEDATITSGETLFFKSSQKDAQGVVEGKVEKEPVDVTLNIKPNISHSNYLTLKVELDSNSVASLTTEGIPRLNKRKTKQIVTVKNGQTVVISGMMKASEYEAYKKIPLLGDIPILGWLFRNSQIETKNTNLVIFITPHIIHGAADLAAIYQQKMEERDQLFKSIYGSGYKKDKFYQRLPSAENGLYLPTEKDEAEDKALAKFRQESFEANSLGQKEKKPAAPSSEPKEEEFTVPGELDSGGGGGGGGDAPPPPPDDFPEESDGGGGGGGDE